MERKIFDDPNLQLRTNLASSKWREIAEHNEREVKGFFGDFRFLSNFWPATVVLDGNTYSSVETAYQSAKFPVELRIPFLNCTPRCSIIIADSSDGKFPEEEWCARKIDVMEGLLIQKFDPQMNPDNHRLLISTGEKYLEETNYWEDIFWGVYKKSREDPGIGENHLGKLLMKIRSAAITTAT